jgi:hypothetical protein
MILVLAVLDNDLEMIGGMNGFTGTVHSNTYLVKNFDDIWQNPDGKFGQLGLR